MALYQLLWRKLSMPATTRTHTLWVTCRHSQDIWVHSTPFLLGVQVPTCRCILWEMCALYLCVHICNAHGSEEEHPEFTSAYQRCVSLYSALHAFISAGCRHLLALGLSGLLLWYYSLSSHCYKCVWLLLCFQTSLVIPSLLLIPTNGWHALLCYQFGGICPLSFGCPHTCIPLCQNPRHLFYVYFPLPNSLLLAICN